jgi:hypothetical protein
MFERPVSEIYANPPYILDEEPAGGHYADWGYVLAHERDEAGNDVPKWGNTVIFRILTGGMTEPVYVTKPDSHAEFNVEVLGGEGVLIRAFSTGAVETRPLAEGHRVKVTPGQAYSYVNIGKSD